MLNFNSHKRAISNAEKDSEQFTNLLLNNEKLKDEEIDEEINDLTAKNEKKSEQRKRRKIKRYIFRI